MGAILASFNLNEAVVRAQSRRTSGMRQDNATRDSVIIFSIKLSFKTMKLNAHGTVWNQTADALVRSNPERYEYVNSPNYWKGIDY